MMKVLLTKKFASTDIDYLEDRLDSGIELVKPVAFDEEAIIEKLPDVQVLFGGLLTERILEKSEHIKFAQIPWTGVDNLNFAMLNRYNLTVCNSHSNARIVAEHAFALALALFKKLPYHDRMMRQGEWNRVNPEGNKVSPFSKNLFNCKVSFIGYGAISQEIHKFLIPFQPVVNAVTQSGDNKHKVDKVTFHKASNISTAVADADLVFVCAPLTEDTKNLIDSDVLNAMPTSSCLVNVARGAIVNEEALYNSLNKNMIAGAAIDTWYQSPKAGNAENFPSNKYEFHSLDNLVMSPHRAGYCDSGFPHLDDAIENLNRCFGNLPLKNIVSTSLNY